MRMLVVKTPRAIRAAPRNLLAAIACSEERNRPESEGKPISNLHFILQTSCLSTVKGQSLQQATIKSRSFCLFNSLSEWLSLREIYDARKRFNRSCRFSLTWFFFFFFISSSLSVYWPREYKVELNEKPKGASVSVNAIFLSLEAKHKANCSPEFLELSSTYEMTFIIPTFFSPNALVLRVLQPLLSPPKLKETQENWVLSF